MTELWISIFGYEYLEFTTIVDIHNSVMETIMDIHICQLNNLQYTNKYL